MIGKNSYVGLVSATALLFASSGALAEKLASNHAIIWQWPLTDFGPNKITQDYAEYGGEVPGLYHTGIDVGTDQNDPEIHPIANGWVSIYVPNDIGCDKDAHKCADHGDGYTLIIEHKRHLYSQYQHMESLEPTLEGKIRNKMTGDCKEITTNDRFGNARDEFRCKRKRIGVTTEQWIGKVGGSGYGMPHYWPIHLHFEIKKFRTLNSPKDPYEWGYSTPHPKTIGYRDPVNFLLGTEHFTPVHVRITADGEGKPMVLGPADNYPEALPASEDSNGYYARRGANPTTECQLGWWKLTKTQAYPPPKDELFTSTTTFAELPDVWMCLGNDVEHPWITGF